MAARTCTAVCSCCPSRSASLSQVPLFTLSMMELRPRVACASGVLSGEIAPAFFERPKLPHNPHLREGEGGTGTSGEPIASDSLDAKREAAALGCKEAGTVESLVR